ncbi:autophagy protein 16 [Durotheca rogersii]|uniref:autophagy protein 16 n=1 Tax=Durotheca rogersii TaxID=419775 RepID=UPI00221ECD1C|nr:autophagy protein 16 [Durotheca rogersii]KAI5863269.1 autophagy protein 16 [Durotheca rogersii]
MPDWRSDYLASLREAESSNPVNKDLVEACSQLVDRVAALEAEKAVWQAAAAAAAPQPSPSARAPPPPPPPTADPDAAQLRLDLAEALRARGQLQARLRAAEDELRGLRARAKVDAKRVADLAAERNSIQSRLKDRNEELAGKNKLLKDVQDENLTLNIQLDVTEQKAARLVADNKDLVDRWMQRMKHEADAMNLENESPGNVSNSTKSRR